MRRWLLRGMRRMSNVSEIGGWGDCGRRTVEQIIDGGL